MKLTNEEVNSLIVCPICRSKLASYEDKLVCMTDKKHTFPKINEIPVLINNETSVFSQEDFLNNKDTFFTQKKMSSSEKILSNLVPQITANVAYKKNYNDFIKSILKISKNPKILIIGDSQLGLGTGILLNNGNISVITTDVVVSSNVQVVCDAHSLPFKGDVFDGVIVQAVLEHVVDPYKCVEEIYRVLKNGGTVYANTPFMQQVHGGVYDFTRFTFLGHRRLFRKFESIDEGISCGPGTALAWSYKYFLLSFSKNSTVRKILKFFAHLTSFYLKYFDYYLAKKTEAYDAASAYYFLGKKTNKVLSDKELIKLYRGAYDK